uniref:Uncharacterized protein n=1 Tax=Arundo donax TaxID=35708 RepID=A0A0A9HRR8_ARUDO
MAQMAAKWRNHKVTSCSCLPASCYNFHASHYLFLLKYY